MSRKKKDKGNSSDKNEATDQTKADNISSGVPRQKTIWVALTIFLFLVSAASIIYAYKAKQEIDAYDSNLNNCSMLLSQTEDQLADKEKEVNRLEYQLDTQSLKAALEKIIGKRIDERYKSAVLKRPDIDIQSNLISRSDLIPYKSQNDRIFRFLWRHQIYILSYHRVLATFSDGATTGWLYLSYSVSKDSKITWKVIDSFCPDCE